MTVEKLVNLLLALFFVMVPAISLFMGAVGRQSRMKSIMFVVPFVSVLLIVQHQFHLQLIILGTILPISLPEQLVHRNVGIDVLIPLLVFIGMVARKLMGQVNTVSTDKRLDIVMGLISFESVLWVVARFPGLGALGSTQSGGWHAILVVAGLCAYWGARSLRGVKPDWKRLMKIMLLFAVLSIMWTMLLAAYEYRSIGVIVSKCFFSVGWWLYAILLGMAVKIWKRPNQPMGMFSTYFISVILLLHALMSSFRSRILFGPFMVGAALWVGGLRKYMIIATVVFFAVSVYVANSRMYNRFPGQVRRVLSVVRTEEDFMSDSREFGEMGRSSPWRMQLWESAWEEISRKPLIGHGFTYSSAMFDLAVTAPGNAYHAQIKGLVLSGEAHNTPLNLMYYLGIPMAVVFCIGWVMYLVSLLKLACRHDGWYGAFLTALLVWTVAQTGQALMNGTGVSFVIICTSMGIYQAVKPQSAGADVVQGESRV